MKTEIRKEEWIPSPSILPLILGSENKKTISKKENAKLELFEKSLSKEIRKDDSIELTVNKIVKIALAAEFGPSLVVAQGAERMIRAISQAILCDAQLRKQALVIVDRFAKKETEIA